MQVSKYMQQCSTKSIRRLRISSATSVRSQKCHPQPSASSESFAFIAKVPGVQAVRVLSDEPWTSRQAPQVLEIKRKGQAQRASDQAKPSASPPPTWRLWPLQAASGQVAGFVNLHLPVLDDGLIVKGVPCLRGSQGDKKVVDLYLFASDPTAHAAAARCAEQHWLQPLVAPGIDERRMASQPSSSSNSATIYQPSSSSKSATISQPSSSSSSSSTPTNSITQQQEQQDGRPPNQASVTEQLLLGDQIPTGTRSSSSSTLHPEQLDEWVLEQSQFAHARLCDCQSDPELARWAQLQLPQEHTFGVEVELLVWRDISQRDLQDMLESQACVAGWRVVRDGSINAPSRGCTAVEVISPVMQGMDGLAQIHRVMAVLASLPAAPNPSCALHVHVGKLGGWDHEHLKHLLHLFATYEPTLDLLVPTHRQGNNNQHCTSVAVPPSGGGGASEAAQQSQDTDSLMNAANPYGRTYKLNVRSIAQHGTVEFRHPGSSCSARTVCGFVALYLLLARTASAKARAGTEGAFSGTQQHISPVMGPLNDDLTSRDPMSLGDGDWEPVEGGQLEEGHAGDLGVCSREQTSAGDGQLIHARGRIRDTAVESLVKLAVDLQAPSMLEWLLWQAAAVKPRVS